MRPEIVVVINVFFQNLAEMLFSKNQEMIQAFSPNGAYASLQKGVCFGRTERGSQKSNSKMFLQDLSKTNPILAVAIGKQVFRDFSIPCCLQNLAVAPVRSRMLGHI